MASSSASAALSDGLFEVLRRGLRADPNARFESMDALLDALDALPADPAPARPSPRSRLLLAAPFVVALAALAYGALPAPDAPAEPLAGSLSEVSPCEGLALPVRTALAGWRGQRLDAWRSEWEESRTQICAGSPTRSAAECLSAQAAEVEHFAVADAPSETFVDLPDPAACEAGAPPLRPELAEARARYRVGDADSVRRSLEEVDSTTTEAMLLGARAERLSAHFEAAAELARGALFKAQLEHDRWNTAEAWLELVVVAGAAGEYEQAARDVAHAEQAVEAANGDSLREQLLHRQGVVRTQLGDFAGARSALSEAVERRSERLGAESVELAPMFTSLGHLARLEDRLDDAFDHHSAARRLNGMLDPEHLWVARDLHNLGGVLRRQHRTAEALDHYHQSIAIRRRQLGPTHPEVALGLNSVGLVLFEKEDFEGARDTWEQARAIFVEHRHADAAMAEHNLALANLALNEPQLALAHALSALHRDEDRLGPDAKRVGVELVTLATALVRLGRVDEAETRAARAKEIAALVGDSALSDEAEAVLAARRPPRDRVVRVNQGDPAPVETEDATPVLDTESDEPADAASTMEREPPARPGGSGSYGGGQAWE